MSAYKPELCKAELGRCPNGALGAMKAVKAVRDRDAMGIYTLHAEIEWCVANGLIEKKSNHEDYLLTTAEGRSWLAGFTEFFAPVKP